MIDFLMSPIHCTFIEYMVLCGLASVTFMNWVYKK